MKHIGLKAGKIALLAAIALVSTGAQPRLGALDDRLLDSHNRERALMGVPALRWNDELARGAQAWADHLSATGRFEHSPNIPGRPLEGENIWGGTPGAFRPEDMIGLWLKEKTYFTPGTFPLNSTTGRPEDVSHYTQLIWSRSGEVGCGISDVGREEILVCRYSEPGNVRGRDPLARSEAAPARRMRYSPFSRPLVASAAGAVRFASAASGETAGVAAPPPLASPSGAPAFSSATRRGGFNMALVFGTVPFAVKPASPIASICGWSASGCSWLTD